jgi:sec-independent protein translocase protein TatC
MTEFSQSEGQVTEEDEGKMSFLDHLGELRQKLIRCAVAITVMFGICVYFSEDLFRTFSGPIVKLLPPGSSLVFVKLTSPFFVYLKLSLLCGFIFALPYVVYQLWKFIYPGLHPHERSLAAPFVIAATLLFYMGAAFAYFLVFPAAFKFLLSFGGADLKPMLDIGEYTSLATMLMLAFGAIFETPIIIVFLGLLGLFSSATLRKGRRYFIVLAFVIAAIISPSPDVMNQTLMAVPMLFFYEIGIFVLRRLEKRRERRAEEEIEAEPSA